jgi:hypothetical protein
MKNLLRLEELAQLALCVFALIALHVPDIGMLGYLINSRVGAITYNLLHHKGLALFLFALALVGTVNSVHEHPMITYFMNTLPIGIILYGHASMDRIFGYGLKFNDSFHHTHLGWIGKGTKEQEQAQ